jgi:hypothetical protein
MKLKIVNDTCAQNPRQWDNLGTIAYKHRNYTLGEETISDPIEWLEEKMNLPNKFIYSNERLKELENLFFERFIALPVYLYDHSGITISTTPFSCPWDSGKVGYIYVSKEKVKREYGVKRITKKIVNKALSCLQAEVKTFDQYITGEVYGFILEDDNDNEVDSCYGFFGDDWNTNGMKDHLPKEVHHLLENVVVEYSY